MGERKSYEDSCRQMVEQGYFETPPPMPEKMPQYDDDGELGVSFFRTGVDGADFSGLTLPRTFFGRSEIARTSFQNSDLSESCLCWNDFIDVDFSGSDLSNADLRASVYERASFAGAKLDGVDMRLSNFTDCRFDGASMRGVVLTNNQKAEVSLSVAQAAEIYWADENGPEPGGG